MTPYLWSLWAMLERYAQLFVYWETELQGAETQLAKMVVQGQSTIGETYFNGLWSTERGLPVLEELAYAVELDAIPGQIDRIRHEVNAATTPEQLAPLIKELRHRLFDQLQHREFYYASPRFARYYDGYQSMPDAIYNFDSAVTDMEEAGKCLALGRGTACVFHLMRVMEVGLNALSKTLGITYAPSWEQHLRQINDKIAAGKRKKGIRWKKDKAFYQEIAGDLMTIKNAWRNPTMHVIRVFDPEEAEEVYRAVRTFMGRLGARIAET